jgi:hypothetical protein
VLRRRPLMRAAVGTAVVAGTATAVSGRVERRQQSSDAAPDESPPAAAAPAPAPAPADATEDPIARLKQLAELHDQGVLTDEEFAAQKAKILG